MKKWVIFVIIFAVLIVGVAATGYYYLAPKETKGVNEGPRINVTVENFPQYLSVTKPIQELPDNALLQLKTTDKEYIVTKGSVKEGVAENPDITIILPTVYIPKLSNGFCKTMSEAYQNGDMQFTLHQSQLSAAWKYKSLMQYKSCLGI